MFGEVDHEQLAKLREPFGPDRIGKLPRITCPNCRDARTKVCQEHTKSKCGECGNWITGRHIHLDYVGHGAVTDRLLEVDPVWHWEPLAFDESGMPTFVYDDKLRPIAFWVKLTVCGVTRLGVGTCAPGQPDAEKVLIGDAVRNSAMRFGVALDLWIKGHSEDDEQTTASADGTAPGRTTAAVARQAAKEELIAAAEGDKAIAATAWDAMGLAAERHVPRDALNKALAEADRLVKGAAAERSDPATEDDDTPDQDPPDKPDLPEISERDGLDAYGDAMAAQGKV